MLAFALLRRQSLDTFDLEYVAELTYSLRGTVDIHEFVGLLDRLWKMETF